MSRGWVTEQHNCARHGRSLMMLSMEFESRKLRWGERSKQDLQPVVIERPEAQRGRADRQ